MARILKNEQIVVPCVHQIYSDSSREYLHSLKDIGYHKLTYLVHPFTLVEFLQ